MHLLLFLLCCDRLAHKNLHQLDCCCLPPTHRHLVEKLNKKSKANNVKPFMVKNHLWVFINAQIENPAFDSQVSLGARHHDQPADSTDMQLLLTAPAAASSAAAAPISEWCLPAITTHGLSWASCNRWLLQLAASCYYVCLWYVCLCSVDCTSYSLTWLPAVLVLLLPPCRPRRR
jgi:hypothetical protein